MQVTGALLGNYAAVKERKMRNSIVLFVVLSALLINPRTNARDICLDDVPSSGLCCFQGPKDWPNLDAVMKNRSGISLDLLDIDALGLSLATWDDLKADVRLQTILTLAADRTASGISAPLWHYAPPAADVDFDTIRLDFTDRPLGFGISIQDSVDLICAGIISAQLSYASAAFNAN